MKNLIYILLIALFLISGCSHTYVLDKESPNEFIEKVNKKTKRKKGVIRTKDGEKNKGKEITVTVDSSSWIDMKTSYYKTIANSELNQIILNDHGKGALEGLGLGILSGFITGFGIGYLSYSEHGNFFDRKDDYATITGTALGLLGGFLGLIGGAAGGAKEIFMFNDLKSEYYVLKNVKILSEAESSIQIIWQNKAVWLDRAEITIKQTDDEIDIRIPDKIYKKKFGN